MDVVVAKFGIEIRGITADEADHEKSDSAEHRKNEE